MVSKPVVAHGLALICHFSLSPCFEGVNRNISLRRPATATATRTTITACPFTPEKISTIFVPQILADNSEPLDNRSSPAAMTPVQRVQVSSIQLAGSGRPIANAGGLMSFPMRPQSAPGKSAPGTFKPQLNLIKIRDSSSYAFCLCLQGRLLQQLGSEIVRDERNGGG